MQSKELQPNTIFALLGVMLFVVNCLNTAFAGGPSIEEIASGVGQRGTSFAVTITGVGFSDDCDFLFYQSGLKCTELKATSDSAIQATIQSEPDCALGSHPFRLRNKDGISELKVLRILPYPIIEEAEPNNSNVESQPVPTGHTVSGVLSSGDVDSYRMTMSRGQRLSAEIESVRLAAHLSDLKLTVIDSQGIVIARADDTSLGKQDPYLTLIVPQDGNYIVKVQASGIEGNDNTRYALHLGNFPRPDYVFPMGGPMDQPTTIKVRGDQTAEWDETHTFRDIGTIGFFPTRDGLNPPTPIPFRVSPFANVLESEPNDHVADLVDTTINLPIALNGTLSKPGDKDIYPFHVEAGWTVEFSVYAAQFGSKADTVIRLLSEDGKVMTTADDQMGYDSDLVWEFKDSGRYFLQVEDKRRSGSDRHVYRVEARSVDPTVVAFLPRRERRSQSRQSITVPQGNRVLGFIGVRRQRWTGEAEIDFPQLPKGMKADFGRVGDDEFVVPVVFEADKDAAIGAELVPVLARAYLQTPTIQGSFEQPVDLVAESADRLYQGVTVDRLAMAVIERTPYKIRFENPPAALPRDGSLALKIHVERDQGFDGAIDVSIPYLPTWVDGPEKITIPGDESVGIFELRSHAEVAACIWPTVAEGKPATAARSRETEMAAATGQAAAGAPPTPPPAGFAGGMRRPRGGRRGSEGGSSEVASQLLQLAISDSPLDGTIGKLVATPGTNVIVSIPLKRSGELPKSLTATLVGLPSRVAAEAVSIDDKTDEVVFTVRLEQDAPLGFFANLFCELTGDLNGHKITYRIGRGSSMKIVPPNEFVLDESGRPLSLLEILRVQPLDGDSTSNANQK